MKVLITTIPFGGKKKELLKILDKENIQYFINPYDRKITEKELQDLIYDYDFLIAGTEPITKNVLKNAKKLKLISRVGAGVGNIDLNIAKKFGIKISYTPNAPTNSVSEITLTFILMILREINSFNYAMHQKIWLKKSTNGLESSSIGIIGFGRIGKKVYKALKSLSTKKLLVYDPFQAKKNKIKNIEFVSLNKLLKNSDIVTIHVPNNKSTDNLINSKTINLMKKEASIINTSRGSIINEKDIYDALKAKRIKFAALDVFIKEPYIGKLNKLDNCILTPHISSLTVQTRKKMELEAINEVLRFKNKKKLKNQFII